jgi:acyl dehydratase
MTREVPLHELAALAGQELGVSAWTDVSQERIDRFAEVTGDYQWMHVDVERATRELGHPIAHGLLILSLVSGLSDEIMRVVGYRGGFSYGFDNVRFTKPVAAGSRVRLRQTLVDVGERNGAALVRVRCTMEVENSDGPALVAEHVGAYYPA